MPGNLSVRVKAKRGEVLHHKQERTVDGVRYKISKVLNPSMLYTAAQNGFTEVFIANAWKPLKGYKRKKHGGDRLAITNDADHLDECLVQAGAAASSGRKLPENASFKVADTTVLVANMPYDVKLRHNTRALARSIGFQSIQIVRGIVGTDVVSSCKRLNGNTCQIKVKREQIDSIGAHTVAIRTKCPERAVGAFGCAMTHQIILEKVRTQHCCFAGGMASYVCVLEDDVQLRFSPQDTRDLIQTLVGKLNQGFVGQTGPDIIYLYTNDARPSQPRQVFAQVKWPFRTEGACRSSLFQLVKTQSSYSTAAFLVKRSTAAKILAYLDVANGTIYNSDGAIRHACVKGEIVCAHVESDIDTSMSPCNLIGQMPPKQKGGSRVTPARKTCP